MQSKLNQPEKRQQKQGENRLRHLTQKKVAKLKRRYDKKTLVETAARKE